MVCCQPATVGRASVGFSAVHAADLPSTVSFMTGSHLGFDYVLFQPHKEYLGSRGETKFGLYRTCLVSLGLP